MMARLRPDVPVSLGFVDVDVPALPGLVRRVVADSNQAVVVPLLLSGGYHVYVDVAAEADRYPGRVHAAAALGPDPVLGRDPRRSPAATSAAIDHVVLAAAGSSDPRALADCSETADLLSARVDRPVSVGYVSGAGERLASVLSRTPGRRGRRDVPPGPRLLRRPRPPPGSRPPGQPDRSAPIPRMAAARAVQREVRRRALQVSSTQLAGS